MKPENCSYCNKYFPAEMNHCPHCGGKHDSKMLFLEAVRQCALEEMREEEIAFRFIFLKEYEHHRYTGPTMRVA